MEGLIDPNGSIVLASRGIPKNGWLTLFQAWKYHLGDPKKGSNDPHALDQ